MCYTAMCIYQNTNFNIKGNAIFSYILKKFELTPHYLIGKNEYSISLLIIHWNGKVLHCEIIKNNCWYKFKIINKYIIYNDLWLNNNIKLFYITVTK